MTDRERDHASARLTYAQLTPSGEGGIGIFQLYGPDVFDRLPDLFESSSGERTREPNRLFYGWIRDGDTRLDEVLVRYVPPGSSVTGTAALEFNTHSGPAVLERIRTRLEDAGAVRQSSAEVLEEASRNGALDALQRKAYEMLGSVHTRSGAAMLTHQLHGRLSATVRGLIAAVRHDQTSGNEARLTDHAVPLLNELVARGRSGIALTTPGKLCVLGPPNAGKSTLVNALSNQETSIVHEEAGTTRDVVHTTVDVRGYPFEVMDTAGLHASDGRVEREGMEKGLNRAAEADLVLWLSDVDARTAPPERLESPMIEVRNKEDLREDPAYGRHHGDAAVRISALHEQGLDELTDLLLNRLDLTNPPPWQGPTPFQSEQVKHLKAAREQVRASNRPGAVEALKRLRQGAD